ncbi:hypothetical protein Dcar01_02408 [Deinococcus carri]|uniref:Uncharacterized protein n=1 Tax=Deinococcus carri TaxID=1211323 RepID=A0ABP9W8M0_9DEIO
MPLVLPKRCPNCGRRCVRNERGYWLCDPAAGGCGWTDDPATVQPLPTAPTPDEAPQTPPETA